MTDVTKSVYTGLTIYESINEQFRNISGDDFHLIAPNDRFLPFMFMRDASENSLTNIKVRNLNDDIVVTIGHQNIVWKILKNDLLSKDWFIYYGAVIPGLSLPCDDYYLEIEDQGGNFWFSEVFRAFPQSQLNNFIRLEFSHSHDIENLIYQDGFVNRLYFDTFIGQPEPGIEEDGKNDGEGNFVPEFQRSFLTHNFKLDLIPSFLVRVLNQIYLHDQISVFYKGRNFYFVKDFEFEGSWVNESFFQGDIKFKTTELINNNCVQNTQFYEIGNSPAENQVPQVFGVRTEGDFTEGQSVSVVFRYFDNEGDPPGQHLYQWLRSDDFPGTNKTPIPGATFSNYILTSDDVGKYVSCEVTPVALTGNSPGLAVESSRKSVKAQNPTGPNIIEIADNGTAEPLNNGWSIKFRVGSEVPVSGSGNITVRLIGTGIQPQATTFTLQNGETFLERQFDNVTNTTSVNQVAIVTISDVSTGYEISLRRTFFITVKP